MTRDKSFAEPDTTEIGKEQETKTSIKKTQNVDDKMSASPLTIWEYTLKSKLANAALIAIQVVQNFFNLIF